MNRRAFFRARPGPPAGPKAPARPLGIRLLQTPPAGFQYHEGERRWTALNPGGDELDLVRKPANPYDAQAVAVYRQADKPGYITRADNTVIANLDQGARVKGRILTKNQSANPWERLGVEVVMKG